MIIRFSKELVSEFKPINFSSLIGYIGLYFIFHKDLLIPYPFRSSRLIYIGMSESRTNSIGNRLKDHVKGHSKNKGIISYHKRWGLNFTYLDYEFLKHMFISDKIEAIETFFLENFSDEFGSYPICNNKRGYLEEFPKINEKPEVDWNFFGSGQ